MVTLTFWVFQILEKFLSKFLDQNFGLKFSFASVRVSSFRK